MEVDSVICPNCGATIEFTDPTLKLISPPPPPPPPPAPGGIVISALALNKTNLGAGGTLTGTVTFTNTSAAPITAQTLYITTRPPGGTNAGGPYNYQLNPQLGVTTIPAGGNVALSASRPFVATDPLGAWYAYAGWQDSTGGWHDGPNVPFTVLLGPPSPPPPPPPPVTPPPTGTGLIPSVRLTTWSPGIPGGIPARTTVFITLAAGATGSKVQAALDACPVGQVVQLSAGDFPISGRLEIHSGIVLRGMGPTTRLKMPIGTNDNVVTIGTHWFKNTQSVNLTSNAVKGSRSVTVASVPPGLAVGEIVLLDELTDTSISRWHPTASPPGSDSRAWFTRPDRPIGQVMEVQSFIGNTITFSTPFHTDIKVGFAGQMSRFSQDPGGPVVPAVKNAGIEDLYISGGGNNQVWFANAAYCWMKNVESDAHIGISVLLSGSFRSVVRDSYIHSTRQPSPGGGGYGIGISQYSSDNLIENNIVWNMNKVMVMQASGGGNVIGYNYMEDGWIDNQTQWVEVGLNASHMTTPHYELFEGNQSFNFDGDNTWGNAVYITVFRNHMTCQRRSIAPLNLTDTSNKRCVGLMADHWWYSFIGNVLGTPGMVASTYESQAPWNEASVIWRIGYNPETWGAADTQVRATTIREGNFDYATNAVHWSGAAQALPDSLYLTAKPAFFGTNPWPWVDPLGVTKTAVLPARARFDAMPTHS